MLFRSYRPVGATDSERAFCYLLERLLAAYPEGTGDLKALHGTIGEVAAYFREHGECNFLLSNGDVLFAHCATNLGYILRRAPFPRAHLVDEDYEVDFNTVASPTDRAVVIATKPLTDNEVWTAMKPGELLAFRDGEPVSPAA